MFKVVFLAFLLGAAFRGHSQGLSSRWSTMDGGGGVSTGGVFRLTGTLGQPEAGHTFTNQAFSIRGGFWAGATAVQAPGAPRLTILALGNGTALVSWPASSGGWILQESTMPGQGWSNSASGGTNPAALRMTSPWKFYRLQKP